MRQHTVWTTESTDVTAERRGFYFSSPPVQAHISTFIMHAAPRASFIFPELLYIHTLSPVVLSQT